MHRPSPALLRTGAALLLAVVGALLGLVLGGQHAQGIGPFDAELSLAPSLHGGTTVELPPLGSLSVASHKGPVALHVRLVQIDPLQARRIMADPAALGSLGDEVSADLRSAVVHTAVQGGVAAVLGAALLPLLVVHRRRSLVIGLAAGLVGLTATAGTAAATFDRGALRAPTFSGLLSSAPAVVGNVQDLVDRFDTYSQQLAGLVGNLSKLYLTTSTLPTLPSGGQVVKFLQVSDVHSNPAAYDVMAQLVDQFGIGAVLDTGDSTDRGASFEDSLLAPMSRLGVPYVWVRGNHDSAGTQKAVQALPGVTVLDGDTTTVQGIVIAGRGDPRYTPDLQVKGTGAQQKVALQQQADLLVRQVEDATAPGVDIVMMHDPADAASLGGLVPLVLAGHLHARAMRTVDGTRILVEGSTGGAGLRALQGDAPTPLEASVLYLDRSTRRLLAIDRITVGGLGLSSVTIERTLVDKAALVPPGEQPAASPSSDPSGTSSADPTSTPSGTVSPPAGPARSPSGSPTAGPAAVEGPLPAVSLPGRSPSGG